MAQLARSRLTIVERAPGFLSPWAVAQVLSLIPHQTSLDATEGMPSGHAADVTVTLAAVQRLLT